MKVKPVSQPKAYVYKRMSTLEQRKGDSSRRQLERAAAYAEAKGLELEPIEDDGVSAFRGDNLLSGRLGVFIARIKSGEIAPGSYLIVESLDRLSRDVVTNAFHIFSEIVNAGLILVTLFDGREYSKETLAKDQLSIFAALFSFATASEESMKKSERLSAVWGQKKKAAREGGKPLSPIVPAWLIYDKQTHTISINEPRAKLVREIFELTINGWGASSIQRLLNQRKEPLWNPSINTTKAWHESYIKKIIDNRSTIGEFQLYKNVPIEKGKKSRVPDGEPIENYFPAVIDALTFDKAKAATAQRRIKGTGRKGALYANLFSGLLRCRCGAGFRYANKGTGPKGGQYLMCTSAKAAGPCTAKYIRYKDFEQLLLSNLLEVDFDRAMGLEAANAKKHRLEQEIHAANLLFSKLEKQKENLLESIRNSDGGVPAFLVADANRIQAEISQIEAAKKTGEAELSELMKLDPAQQKQVVQRLISQLEGVDDDVLTKLRRHLAQDLKKVIRQISVHDEIIPVYDQPSQGVKSHKSIDERLKDYLIDEGSVQRRHMEEEDFFEAMNFSGYKPGYRVVVTYYSGVTQSFYSDGSPELTFAASSQDILMRAKQRS